MADVPRLGRRGGGWVVLQFVVIAAVLGLGVTAPGWPDGARWWLKAAGAVFLLGGLLVVALAGRALGRGFTPLPKPAEAGELVEDGPFAVVRHPVYSGGLLVAAGISFALSPWSFVPTGVLAVVWALKATVEERFLLERYPNYVEYCSRTRYRLVPFVY